MKGETSKLLPVTALIESAANGAIIVVPPITFVIIRTGLIITLAVDGGWTEKLESKHEQEHEQER